MAQTQISPVQVREALVECFVDAQFKKFQTSSERMGFAKGRDEIRGMIEVQVKEAFTRVGAKYDDPKKGDFEKVMEILARKALGMGESTEVIEGHRAQMMAMVAQMKD